MIRELVLQNIKGATRRLVFSAGNLVQGRNFSGKSAVDQGIRALVLGYAPGIKPESTAGLKIFCSAYPASISAEIHLSDGLLTSSVAFDKSKKQSANNTLASLGKTDEATRVLFDPSIFFGLSDAARISKACELVQSVGGNVDGLDTAIVGCIPADASSFLRDSLKHWREVVKSQKTFSDTLGISESYWKGIKSDRTAEKSRLTKMAEGLTDLNTVEAELARLSSRSEVEAQRKQVAEKLHSLTSEISAAKASARMVEHRANMRARLANSAASLDQSTSELQRLKATLSDLDAKLADVKPKLAAAQEKVSAAKREAATPAPVPTNEVRTDDFTTGADPSKEYVANCRIRLTEAGIEVLDVVEWSEVYQPNPEAEEAARAHQCELSQAVEDAVRELSEITAVADDIVAQQRTCLNSISYANGNVVSAQRAADELKRLDAEPVAAAKTPEEITKLEQEREDAQVRYNGLDEQLQQITRFEQDKKRIEDSARIRAEVETHLEAVKRILEIVAEKKQELVSASIEAPLAVANKLAAGILKGPLVFEEGEIGMRVDTRFVSSRAFSGTESAIVMMGLTAGLAHKSNLRVLLLDEIGRLDTPNAVQLIANLATMVNDRDIDQFILIGPDNPALVAALNEPGRSFSDGITVLNVE
jgi:hypothetical protein